MNNIIPQNSPEQKGDDLGRLMTGPEVAAQFRVAKSTVRRWAAAGRLVCILTPGGQRRYPENAVRALVSGGVA